MMYISWCIFSFSEYWCHRKGQWVLMPSWRTAWSCDLRANERPKNKLHEKGTNRAQTDRHRDSMKESAKGPILWKIHNFYGDVCTILYFLSWDIWYLYVKFMPFPYIICNLYVYFQLLSLQLLPSHSTAMGFHPPLWTLMKWVGSVCYEANLPIAQLWCPTPNCEFWWMGWEWGCCEANLPIAQLWAPTPHCECWWMGWEWGCYEANLPIALKWVPTPHYECWWMGWKWGCYEGNLPIAQLWAANPHCECWWMWWELDCYEANLAIAQLWAPTHIVNVDEWGGSEVAMKQTSPSHRYGLPALIVNVDEWSGREVAMKQTSP